MVALHPADGNQSTICNHLYRLYIVQVQMENLACMGDKHACGGHAVDMRWIPMIYSRTAASSEWSKVGSYHSIGPATY